MPSPISIIPGSVLTAALIAYYTVPMQDQKLRQAELSCLRFVNTDAVVRTVTLHVVPRGDVPTPANVRFKTLALQPAASGSPPAFFHMSDVMLPGASVYAMADVAGVVSLSASGVSYP